MDLFLEFAMETLRILHSETCRDLSVFLLKNIAWGNIYYKKYRPLFITLPLSGVGCLCVLQKGMENRLDNSTTDNDC